MPGKFSSERLTRRKYVEFGDTALPRVLTLLDLTALGIGSTVGVGFYVLAGKELCLLSFLSSLRKNLYRLSI